MKTTKLFVTALVIGVFSCGAFAADFFSDDFNSYAEYSNVCGQGRWGGEDTFAGEWFTANNGMAIRTSWGTYGTSKGMGRLHSGVGAVYGAGAYINLDQSHDSSGTLIFAFDVNQISGTGGYSYISLADAASGADKALWIGIGNSSGNIGFSGANGVDMAEQWMTGNVGASGDARLTLTVNLTAKTTSLEYVDLNNGANTGSLSGSYTAAFAPSYIYFLPPGYAETGYDNVSLTPEPVTLGLLACGAGLMLFKRRR